MTFEDNPASLTNQRNTWIQSPYLILQAAGSDGHDSSEGVHLRWFLNGYLGEHHIPKGSYAGNTDFFNKANDFVRLFRIPYDQPRYRYFTFERQPLFTDNSKRSWTYEQEGNTFYLRFIDSGQYDRIINSGIDPRESHFEFLRRYGNAELELELDSHLSFALNFHSSGSSEFQVETFSALNTPLLEDQKRISARKRFFAGDGDEVKVIAENIKTVALKIDPNYLGSIRIGFETYLDVFLTSDHSNTIQFIDNFALTTDDNVAFDRLEEISRFRIDGSWLKFNDGAYVNAENYRDRWLQREGIGNAVREYIALSDFDPYATRRVTEESDPDNPNGLEISLQNLLNITSIDYHIARMLGLGYIDTLANLSTRQFIYLAEYITIKNPENFEIEKEIRHCYMSLPTGNSDQRLPLSLKLKPLTYGLKVENGTSTPLKVTDNDGYAIGARSRFVNLKAVVAIDYQTRSSFFNPPIEFQSSDFSIPVLVGIENRKEPETDWIIPEIFHDSVYRDTLGNLESLPIIINKSEKPDFIHEVTEEGIDEYACYGINVFSRVSPLSGIEKTDQTIFRKYNTLKAPTNTTVQLIQSENPLLLTASAEQAWLENIDSSKTEILCRLTFDYYHIHDLNYKYGNKVRIFHKKRIPEKIIGSLTAIDNTDPANPHCLLNTGDYTYLSNGQVFSPKVIPGNEYKFIGGILTYQSVNYIIEDFIRTNSDGLHPQIKIRKIENRNAEFIGNRQYQVTQSFEHPLLNQTDAFLMVENLAPASNWAETTNNQLSFEVDLGSVSWSEKTEKYNDTEGNERIETLKGIWDLANITLLSQGVYEIEFQNTVLDNHPQFKDPDNADGESSVNWYRGFVRVRTETDSSENLQRKLLKVDQILGIGTPNKLRLIATDPDFLLSDPDHNIKIGSDHLVNFHPGYRVYLRKENAKNFNPETILPLEGEGTRLSILGLQTLDTTTLDSRGEPYSSPVGVPALLLAREIIHPRKPKPPAGTTFANPPDFYNKANYSFTTEFEHKPWGIVVYRIDNNKILSSLYEDQTIKEIKRNLPMAEEDNYLAMRWTNLLSFDYSSNFGDFAKYPTEIPRVFYKFPKPDRKDIFTTPFNKPADVVELIKEAIYSNLLPMTEQPLIFKFIKGESYVPQPKRQKITDSLGRVLDPTSSEFDQAPMAKKLSDKKVLFTDFTLDGNMDSDTLYFYVVRELSNSMQLGEASKFVGPVRLLNTKAPEKLTLRRLYTRIASEDKTETAVVFEINNFSKRQGISKIQIQRTLDSGEAISHGNLPLVKEIDVRNLQLTGEFFTIYDDFRNDPEIPYGLPLYYKLVGVRVINYVDVDNMQRSIEVFSESTQLLIANVIDVKKPLNPELAVTNFKIENNFIKKIQFSWERSCFNGRYQIYILLNNTWKKFHQEPIIDNSINTDSVLVHEFDCNRPVADDIQEKITYKFKIEVENSSGIINEDPRICNFTVAT